MGQCKETTRGIRICTLGLRKNKRTNISMSDNDQHKQKEQFTFMIFTTKCGGLFIAIVHLSRHPDPWIYSKFNVFSFSMASVVPFPRAHCSLPPRMFSIFSNRSFPLSPLATGLPFSFTALNSHPLFYLSLALCLFVFHSLFYPQPFPPPPSLMSAHNHRAMCMVNHVVAHAAHDGPSHGSQTSGSQYNHGGATGITFFHNALTSTMARRQDELAT